MKNVWVVKWTPKSSTKPQEMWVRRDMYPTVEEAEAKLRDLYEHRIKTIDSIEAEAR